MCVKAWLRISVGLAVASGVLIAAVVAVCVVVPSLSEYGLPMGIAPLLAIGGSALARDHARGLVQDMNFLCCTDCGYDLSKQKPQGTELLIVICPECGHVQNQEAVQEYWRARFAPKLSSGFD